LKKIITFLVLAAVGGIAFMDRCTMAVNVGDERRIIVADWDDYARIWDSLSDEEYDYRIEAVDGGPVMRRDHSYITYVPLVMLEEGEYLLTVGKGKRWLFEPPDLELLEIKAKVSAGKLYRLSWENDQIVLQED
jgi:hypothetical protein